LAVYIRNLTKSLGGREVFRDFSLEMPDTGCVCFFGPSGSGKTTLLNLLAGIVLPDAGSIEFTPGSRLSYVFQEDRLLPWISAAENVKLVVQDKKDVKTAAERWLKEVSLEESADKIPGELSGGMRQRVALARAFAYGGNILLLDEPFQGIDAQIKSGLISLLSKMKTEKLLVLITHYPEEAARLSDMIHAIAFPPVRIMDTLRITDEIRGSDELMSQTIRKLASYYPSAGQPLE
jgi:ABC-type nitrate/sulfonate/bicarbonate transport system ATPase subunit